MFTGVNVGTQACCDPVLQSITGQWGMPFAMTNAAVHWGWVIAHLYEQQISTGAPVGTQACCDPVLQSITGQMQMQMQILCTHTTAGQQNDALVYGPQQRQRMSGAEVQVSVSTHLLYHYDSCILNNTCRQ